MTYARQLCPCLIWAWRQIMIITHWQDLNAWSSLRALVGSCSTRFCRDEWALTSFWHFKLWSVLSPSHCSSFPKHVQESIQRRQTMSTTLVNKWSFLHTCDYPPHEIKHQRAYSWRTSTYMYEAKIPGDDFCFLLTKLSHLYIFSWGAEFAP